MARFCDRLSTCSFSLVIPGTSAESVKLDQPPEAHTFVLPGVTFALETRLLCAHLACEDTQFGHGAFVVLLSSFLLLVYLFV